MKAKITKAGKVRVTMSKGDAAILRAILRNVGGCHDGPRGRMSRLDQALGVLPVGVAEAVKPRANQPVPGTIYMNDGV